MANLANKKRKERTPIGSSTDTEKSRRIPLLDPRDRLAFPQDPKFHRVWVTDVKGQVSDYLDSGFSFCNKKDIGWVGESHIEDGSQMDTLITRNVGKAGTEDNAIAYLMQMPKEEYELLRKAISEERQKPLREIKEASARLKDRADFYGKGVELK